MTPEPLAFIVILAGLVASDAALLYLQIGLCLLGAAAALSLPALGGATITPASLFLPFFVFRAVRARGLPWLARAMPRAGVWLGLAVAWGLVSAILLPRFFAGQTQILTVDRAASDLKVTLYQLRPVSGNITQSVYLVGNFFGFIAARTLLAGNTRMAWFRDAVLFLAALNACAALLNLAEFWLGAPQLLKHVRTANYAVFDTYEEAGLVRIQGTFAETAAFSSFTLPLFAFTTTCWLHRVRPTYSGAVALASLALLLSSTSGTAYTGLALYLTCLCILLAWRGLSGGVPRSASLLGIGGAVALALCYVLSFEPRMVQRVAEFFELTVLNKLQSQSGLERSSWNQQAWRNVLDTWGVGVGLGSARASSFPLVLLSNLGLLGVLTFGGFLYELARSGFRSNDTPVSTAARHAAFASLIAATISGTVFDLGIVFYLFAAAATTGAATAPEPTLGRRRHLHPVVAPAAFG